MKQAKFTFALLMTTCIAWGCTTQGISAVPSTVPARVAGPGSEVGVTASVGPAATSKVNPADPNLDPGVAALKAALHARYPATQFREVAATPSAGIYEVVMGNKVAYTDVTGRYFLFGHLFDMVTQQDLTVPLEQALQKVRFPADRLQDAFVEVHGSGRRKLAIFDDPDCPYCLALEDDLSKLKDVTIYRFMYPLESIHPRARAHSIAIWCAEDRLATWHAWMPSHCRAGCAIRDRLRLAALQRHLHRRASSRSSCRAQTPSKRTKRWPQAWAFLARPRL